MENTVTVWMVLFNIASFVLLFSTPLAGFALLDIFRCCRDKKKLWLPSQIILVAFIWSLGWTVLCIWNYV